MSQEPQSIRGADVGELLTGQTIIAAVWLPQHDLLELHTANHRFRIYADAVDTYADGPDPVERVR